MGMEPELDAGPILSLRSFPLSPRDTAGDLVARISRELPSFLREGLERLTSGALSPTPQDPSRATYAGKLDRNDRRIPWEEGVERVDRWVRAFSPSPGAWSLLRDREIKILSGIPRRDLSFPPEVPPGTLVTKEGKTAELIAVTGDRCGYEILIVKPEGKKTMSAQEFLRGAHLRPGERLL
jgi:methionyl-tRNA formyltransferase